MQRPAREAARGVLERGDEMWREVVGVEDRGPGLERRRDVILERHAARVLR